MRVEIIEPVGGLSAVMLDLSNANAYGSDDGLVINDVLTITKSYLDKNDITIVYLSTNKLPMQFNIGKSDCKEIKLYID